MAKNTIWTWINQVWENVKTPNEMGETEKFVWETVWQVTQVLETLKYEEESEKVRKALSQAETFEDLLKIKRTIWNFDKNEWNFFVPKELKETVKDDLRYALKKLDFARIGYYLQLDYDKGENFLQELQKQNFNDDSQMLLFIQRYMWVWIIISEVCVLISDYLHWKLLLRAWNGNKKGSKEDLISHEDKKSLFIEEIYKYDVKNYVKEEDFFRFNKNSNDIYHHFLKFSKIKTKK